MKKIAVIALVAILCLSLVACGGKEVSDITVGGETVSVTDFLAQHLGEYMQSESFTTRRDAYAEHFCVEPSPFVVTDVIEVLAEDMEAEAVDVHYLAVVVNCWYAIDEEAFSDRLLLAVNYDTGEVCDPFMVQESWMNEPATSSEYWFFRIHYGALCSSDYDGGAIFTDSETRTELPKADIDALNTAIGG